MSDPLVSIENLKTYFDTDDGVVKAVDDVSLSIERGRTLGLVGESGCGKSVTAMSVIRLISPPGRIAGGRIVMYPDSSNGASAAGNGMPVEPSFSGQERVHEPSPSGRGQGEGATRATAATPSPQPSPQGEREFDARPSANRSVSIQDSAPLAVTNRSAPIVLSELSEAQMRRVRGGRISMIFQEPMTSLNPVFTIGAQIVEAIMLHQRVDKREARHRAIEMLRKVKIPEPQRRVNDYPHQFSGGMRQRAMIAMALSCNPQLLIADEPTTALDVTIQAQILDLLRDLQSEVGMSILIITHDLGIVAEMADDVAVMYASKVVETAPVKELFDNPLHPYTFGLFASRPEPGKAKSEKLTTIAGMVPSPLRFPAGCKFHPRCPFVADICKADEPPLREIRPGHFARCHFAGELDFRRGGA